MKHEQRVERDVKEAAKKQVKPSSKGDNDQRNNCWKILNTQVSENIKRTKYRKVLNSQVSEERAKKDSGWDDVNIGLVGLSSPPPPSDW